MMHRQGPSIFRASCITRASNLPSAQNLQSYSCRAWSNRQTKINTSTNAQTTPSDHQLRHYSTNTIEFASSQDPMLYDRTMCGEINKESDHINLWGWIDSIRPKGTNLTFGTLRDYTGVIQIVFAEECKQHEQVETLSEESVVFIQGSVRVRQQKAKQVKTESDHFEVYVSQFEILNQAIKPLPTDAFSSRSIKIQQKKENEKQEKNEITESIDAEKEKAKLIHRVLYLRTEDMQHRLRTRAKAYSCIRNHLENQRFLEVETPTLFKRTAEGAKEFIVPSSSQLGKFYALVQSPQQYKQLLMASGIDRYYQMARCYRDEALRADRQPEFTQLDMEISCTNVEQIYLLMENLLADIWQTVRQIKLETPFPRLSYADAISLYGSDKPDTRFGFQLCNITDTVRYTSSNTEKVESCEFSPISVFDKYLKQDGGIIAVNITGLGSVITSKQINLLKQQASSNGASTFIVAKVEDYSSTDDYHHWTSSFNQHVNAQPTIKRAIERKLEVKPGDLILICCEPNTFRAQSILGKIRLSCATLLTQHNLLTISPDQFNFLWVTEFPLLTQVETNTSDSAVTFECSHHPFTAPVTEDVPLLDTNPVAVRGLHYDCVVNGVELGGGSIRIHNADLQRKIFTDVLNLSEQQIHSFKHLLDALDVGCPPHGGIAFGLDRMIAMLCNVSSIREVIAFPKSQSGRELLTDTPSTLPHSDLNSYGLHLQNEIVTKLNAELEKK